MRIETILGEADELLYDHQREAIRANIKEPIVAIKEDPSDPVWTLLDEWMTTTNNIRSMSRDGDNVCSIHELLPGHNAVWLMDDYPYQDETSSAGSFVLINAEDLQSIREGGKYGLVHKVLFGRF